jgi:hypothetical protein
LKIKLNFHFREVHIDSEIEDKKPSQPQQASRKRSPFQAPTSNGKIKLICKSYFSIEQ